MEKIEGVYMALVEIGSVLKVIEAATEADYSNKFYKEDIGAAIGLASKTLEKQADALDVIISAKGTQ